MGSAFSKCFKNSQNDQTRPQNAAARYEPNGQVSTQYTAYPAQQPDRVSRPVEAPRTLSSPSIPQNGSQRNLLVALYAYESQHKDDLSFQKGERLELVEKQDCGWWVAKQGNRIGYVPANYVQVDDGRPENSDSYFDVVRRDAERLLLAPFVKEGQFIVRPSSDTRSLALSVRTHDVTKDLPAVRHYRIRMMDNDRGYYIATQATFKTFADLIEHYRSRSDGLCAQLTTACPKSRPTHLRMRDVEVPRRNVTMLREIGRGNFGEVYYGKLNGVIEVAVKQLKNNGQMTNDKFLKEAQIMHKLVHEKIVQLIAVCTKESPILIITEFMPKGSLIEYLRDLSSKPWTACPPGWNQLEPRFSKHIDMMAQIAMGMAYLETNNFIHRDLRAANILVGDDNVVKVSDFGLAALIEEQTYTAHEETKFPIRWTAPEAIYDRRFSIKSDVWSFGVLVYEIVTMGRQPYPGMSNKEVIESVNSGYRMPNPNNGTNIMCPPALYDEVMLKCWKPDADSRPRFERLAEMLDSFETGENEIRYDGDRTGRTVQRKK